MRQTDIAIIGGGLAGSTAAAMLGRAGVDAVLIDPHAVAGPDFRCEKLDGSQIELLKRTGLADGVSRAATLDGEVWVARRGRLVEKRPNYQYGILYDTLVNSVRAQMPPGMAITGKAAALSTSDDRQTITLADGSEISARLAVLANGLNVGLRHTLGMERDILSPSHSISIGFNIKPRGRSAFDFRGMTYYAEKPADRMAYFTLFPIGQAMRVNLFVYREMSDPWLRWLRESPHEALFATMPGLHALTGDFDIVDFIKIRPVDLYTTKNYRQPGVVLIGDAFSTSCPAAGTGTNKVLTDAVRLCGHYIPRWLQTDGMGAEKIAQFYADPEKQACDANSLAKAFFLRSLSLDESLPWCARRAVKFFGQSARGMLRAAAARSSGPGQADAAAYAPAAGVPTATK